MKKRNKDIFKYNRILKPICEKITNHKHKRLIGWTNSFSERGYKYANRADFHYKCKICGYIFFNHEVNERDLEFIKEYDRKNSIDNKDNKWYIGDVEKSTIRNPFT